MSGTLMVKKLMGGGTRLADPAVRPGGVRCVRLLLVVVVASCATKPEPAAPDRVALAAGGTGVRLVSGRELPDQAGIADELVQELLRPRGTRIHLFVRMRGALTLEDHRELDQAGARLLDFLGHDTYVASLPLPVDLRRDPYAGRISWAERILPADKLHPDVLEVGRNDQVRPLVVFFDDVEPAAAEAVLREAKLQASFVGEAQAWKVEADLEQLRSLAREDSVSIIVPAAPQPKPSNDTAREDARTEDVQQATFPPGNIIYGGPTGEGIRIGICDFGFDEDHPDFGDWDGNSPCVDYLERRVYASRCDNDQHGTHVASIAAGNGLMSEQFGDLPFNLRGHAPEACLGDYSTFAGDPCKNFCAIVCDLTDVTNHSYPIGNGPKYSVETENVDKVIRGGWMSPILAWIPSRPQVWAAGNCGVISCNCPEDVGYHGYYAVAVAAKNAICVGSVDTDDEELSRFSSLGPTFDGRLKPDLVAPGAHTSEGDVGIWAANTAPNNDYNYRHAKGTSQAAPVVTGTIALMMETLSDAGGAPRSLRASTFKAILIHTADDRVQPQGVGFVNPDTGSHPVTYDVGPDYATGYGLVNAEEACSTIANLARWREASVSLSGMEREFCFDVPPSTSEVKVTLAWDDSPGSLWPEETSPTLINDLDLVLRDPGGEEHLPWVVAPPPQNTAGGPDPIGAAVPPAMRGIDRTNNVEMVSVTDPLPGRWIARVRAFQLPFARSQPFSLVGSQDMRDKIFCFRFPSWEDLCEQFPWLCSGPGPTIPPFDSESGTWTWESQSLLPISELRKIAGRLPLHDDRAWLPGPGFEIVVQPLAGAAILVLFDQNGTIVARALAQEGEGRVRTEGVPADAQLYLLLATGIGQPFSGPSSLEIGVEMLN